MSKMGIKNLNKFLREKCPHVFEPIHISHYGFKKVAIDISLYLHKFKAIAGDQWLGAFLNLIASLRRNQIHCVFIFDGKSPPEKEEEKKRRQQERLKLEKYIYELEDAVDEYHKIGVVPEILIKLYRRRKAPRRLLRERNEIDMEWVLEKVQQKRNQIINIQPSDFESAKELFDILNVPYYTAPWEAEKMCAKLCLDGLVDAVLSEDTDVIAYMAPVFLTKIDTRSDTAIRLRIDSIQEALGLIPSHLLDLCIMCGTDYNSNIFGIGAHKAYKKIQQFGDIDGITLKTKLDTSILKHKRVRELFTRFEDYKIDSIPYCGAPDYDKLLTFLLTHKIWRDSRKSHCSHLKMATAKLEKLRKDFTLTVIVFDEDETQTK